MWSRAVSVAVKDAVATAVPPPAPGVTPGAAFGIGVEGARALAPHLRAMRALHRLFLGGNNIGAEGARGVSDDSPTVPDQEKEGEDSPSDEEKEEGNKYYRRFYHS